MKTDRRTEMSLSKREQYESNQHKSGHK